MTPAPSLPTLPPAARSRLETAERFMAMGLIVIPYTQPYPGNKRAGKIPMAGEDGHRIDCRTVDELLPVLRRQPGMNIAVLGLAQVDTDNQAANRFAANLGVTSDAPVWVIKTGRPGGYRLLYRAPDRDDLLNVVKNGDPEAAKEGRELIELDLLIHSPALVPPSVHPSGIPYRWVAGHSPTDIAYEDLSGLPVLIEEHWANRCRRDAPVFRGQPLTQPPGFEAALRAFLETRTRHGSLRSENAEGWINEISCPFEQNHAHGDRDPSFGVNFRYGAYKCLSACGSGSLTSLARAFGLPTATAQRRRGGGIIYESAEG